MLLSRALALLVLVLIHVAYPQMKRVTVAMPFMDESKKAARQNYVDKLKFVFNTSANGDRYALTLKQKAPPSEVYYLDAVLYTKLTNGTRGVPLVFNLFTDSDKNYNYFTTEYDRQELNERFGCETEDTNEYAIRMCNLEMQYLATDEGNRVLRTVNYSLSVKIDGEGRAITNGSKIENVGSEVIEYKYRLNIEIYNDSECKTRLAGLAATYGSRIWLKVTTDNPEAKKYYFDTVAIKMEYMDYNKNAKSVNMLPISTYGCGNPCLPGQAIAGVDIIAVGSPLMFTYKVRLKGKNITYPDDQDDPDPANESLINMDSVEKANNISVTGIPCQYRPEDKDCFVTDSASYMGISSIGMLTTVIAMIFVIAII